MEDSESLHPLAVLATEMKTEDATRRVKSLAQVRTTSVALGPERTRAELLPYLSELADDDPPVQLELCRQLAKLTDFVGGKAFAYVLLDPLETLAAADDPEVRLEATRGISEVAGVIGDAQICDIVLDICRNLGDSQAFNSKLSSLSLISLYYPRFSKALHRDALSLYDNLSKETVAGLRKAAAEGFPALAATAGLAVFDILSSFVSDREESVRVPAVAGVVAMAGSVPQSKRGVLLPTIRNFSEDKAGKVRLSLADRLHDLAAIFGPEISIQVFTPIFLKLMSDSEAQIRVAVCSHFSEFLFHLPVDSACSHIFPSLSTVVTDTEAVKKAFAGQIGAIAGKISQASAQKYMFPMVFGLLRDESLEVTLLAVRGTKELVQTAGSDMESAVVDSLHRVMRDRNWRVRLEICDIMTDFSKAMQCDLFLRLFASSFLALLQDSAFTVRNSALETLPSLLPLLSADKLLPLLLSLKAPNCCYTHRITLLKALTILSGLISLSEVKKWVVKEAVEGSADRVPHVRFSAGKAAEVLKKFQGDEDVVSTVESTLPTSL